MLKDVGMSWKALPDEFRPGAAIEGTGGKGAAKYKLLLETICGKPCHCCPCKYGVA